MSGPESEASARGTTFTRLLKSLKTRVIFTFGYCFSKLAESCFSTGSRPGSWLSYDQMVIQTGPSFWKPDFCTAPVGEDTAEPGEAPGVPPHPVAAASAVSAAAIARFLLASCRFMLPSAPLRRKEATIATVEWDSRALVASPAVSAGGYSPSPRPSFDRPAAIPRAAAVRHIWGDEESGEVADRIYASTERIHALVFCLPRGGTRRCASSVRRTWSGAATWASSPASSRARSG